MRQNAPTIGDAGRERARALGGRTQGVTVREIEEEFEVTFSSAWRYVQRLVRERVLYRSDVKRRRVDVFGERAPGSPGVVYRSKKPSAPDELWGGAQKHRRVRAR